MLRHKSQLQCKIKLSNFQSQRPLSSFTPNQREGIMSFFTVLFRTLDFTCTSIFHFYFALFHFVHLYIFTFYIFTLPFYSYFYKRKTTPKKGRDIIPDIFDPIHQPDPTLMNRAFWRQNTRIHFTFNKPAPFGAKLSGAFHWNCSTPFLFSIRFFDPDQPFLLCI